MSDRARVTALKALLWTICVYHALAGVAGTLFQEQALGLAQFLFGVSIELTPQVAIVVRYAAALCLAVAVLAGLAARDPARNQNIIIGLAVYFGVRAFDRVVFYDLLDQHRAGGVPGWVRILMILLFGGGILVLSLVKPRPANAEA